MLVEKEENGKIIRYRESEGKYRQDPTQAALVSQLPMINFSLCSDATLS